MKTLFDEKETNFRRQFVKSYKGSQGETNNEPSETIPDQSLTVRQLLDNHTRGINNPVKHYDPQYFETEIPNFTDLTEIVEYKENLANQIKEVEKQIKEEQKRKSDEQKQKQKEKDSALHNEPNGEPKTSETPNMGHMASSSQTDQKQ